MFGVGHCSPLTASLCRPACAGLQAMQQVLRERGLLTAGVQQELEAGRCYWQQERRLCSLMLQHPTVPAQGHGSSCGFSLEEALQASAAKSFDYRLLNHLVFGLRGEEPDEALLRFLRVDEMLVDIGGASTHGRWVGLHTAVQLNNVCLS